MTTSLFITFSSAQVSSSFFPLFGQGFTLRGPVGCSVREFLCEHLDLPSDYLEQRVLTLFLDGRPVDDVDTALVQNGARLALSGAMPGLVGAAMRRGGYYANLRQDISYQPKPVRSSGTSRREGSVLLKLFNLVAKEQGAHFLGKGIWVDGSDLAAFFKEVPKGFWNGCRNLEVDGRAASAAQVRGMKWASKEVFLRAQVIDNDA